MTRRHAGEVMWQRACGETCSPALLVASLGIKTASFSLPPRRRAPRSSVDEIVVPEMVKALRPLLIRDPKRATGPGPPLVALAKVGSQLRLDARDRGSARKTKASPSSRQRLSPRVDTLSVAASSPARGARVCMLNTPSRGRRPHQWHLGAMDIDVRLFPSVIVLTTACAAIDTGVADPIVQSAAAQIGGVEEYRLTADASAADVPRGISVSPVGTWRSVTNAGVDVEGALREEWTFRPDNTFTVIGAGSTEPYTAGWIEVGPGVIQTDGGAYLIAVIEPPWAVISSGSRSLMQGPENPPALGGTSWHIGSEVYAHGTSWGASLTLELYVDGTCRSMYSTSASGPPSGGGFFGTWHAKPYGFDVHVRNALADPQQVDAGDGGGGESSTVIDYFQLRDRIGPGFRRLP
jgi:hypothetical protein